MDNLVEKLIPFIDAATLDECPQCGERITVLSEQAARYIKQAVLSNLVEIDPDAELPTSPFKTDVAYYDTNREHKAYKRCLKDMAGWVKPKELKCYGK